MMTRFQSTLSALLPLRIPNLMMIHRCRELDIKKGERDTDDRILSKPAAADFIQNFPLADCSRMKFRSFKNYGSRTDLLRIECSNNNFRGTCCESNIPLWEFI